MTITRIGINGFGRIGRQLFKIIWDHFSELQVAAIGVADPTKTDVRALLLQHDTTYGRFPHNVEAYVESGINMLCVDSQGVPLIPRCDPQQAGRWSDYGIDIVIDATGACKHRAGAEAHLLEGVKKVVITCPVDWADTTFVYGINHHRYDPTHHSIISASSCTTTSLAPVSQVLAKNFGMAEAFVNTIHAYTNSQSLLDSAHKDPRRARAASNNIIPTTTGAAKTLEKVIPGLGVRLNASSLRVPVPTVSMLDIVARLEQPATSEQINEAYSQAAAGPLRGILEVSHKPLVSSDYISNPHSATIDALSTSTIGQLTRVAAWYDNEWGYSSRVADLVAFIAGQEQLRWTPDLIPAYIGTESSELLVNSI